MNTVTSVPISRWDNDTDTFDNETNLTVKKESCVINEIPETTEKLCGNVTKTREIPTYKVIQEQGVSLDKEVALMKQALFELKEENIKLTERLNKLEGKQ